MAKHEITCIGCPLGCHVILSISPSASVEKVSGHSCKEGKKYSIAEFQNPVRFFTTTLLPESGGRLLPVRTDKPVPKSRLKELMRVTAKIKVKPPVRAGQEIVHNILGTGANLISTADLHK
jgi:CxxC motif-containing protein